MERRMLRICRCAVKQDSSICPCAHSPALLPADQPARWLTGQPYRPRTCLPSSQHARKSAHSTAHHSASRLNSICLPALISDLSISQLTSNPLTTLPESFFSFYDTLRSPLDEHAPFITKTTSRPRSNHG